MSLRRSSLVATRETPDRSRRSHRALQFEQLDERRMFAVLSLSNNSVPENAVAGVIGNVLVDGAVSSSTKVTVDYVATVVTVAQTPFGFTNAQARLQTVTGSFTYDLTTADQNGANLANGEYKHFSGGAFSATVLGMTITGSAAPHVQVQNFDPGTSDTFRFIDGPRTLGASGGVMLVNGNAESDVKLFIAFVDGSGNAFSNDALPNPLPFAVPPLSQPSPWFFPHTFSLEDSGGTMLLQLDSIQMRSAYTFTTSDNRFQVVNGQLKLASGVSFNHEATASVPVSITATDASNVATTQAFTINVTNVNEAPSNIAWSRATIFNATAGAWIAGISFSDPDRPDSHTITFNDTRFVATQGNLYLKAGQAINQQAGTTFSLQITVTDAGGLSTSRTIPLTVLAKPANWTNAHQWGVNPFDVDADGTIAPLDALQIINALNARGVDPLTNVPVGTLPPLFLDVSNDFSLNPADALAVINYLNSGASLQAESVASTAMAVDAVLAADEAGSHDALALWLALEASEPAQTRSRRK